MAVTQTIGGNPYISTNSKNPYQDIYNQYAKAQEQVKADNQKAWETRRANDTAQVNSNYDSSSKTNYLNYMRQQNALPSQLQRLGVNGGANESALLRLNTAYGQNVANNENARNSAISSLNNTYENEWTDYLNNYNQNLAQALTEAQQNDITYQRELSERDLQQFAASITGRFATRGEYATLIAQLRKSNDPNKDYKIALAQQAMNNMTGASSGGYGGSGGYYSSSNNQVINNSTSPRVASAAQTDKNLRAIQNLPVVGKGGNSSTNNRVNNALARLKGFIRG